MRLSAPMRTVRIVSADPAAQRLPVDPEVIGDLRDRRTRPRPVQRDRVGLELSRVVLVHHRVPELLSTRIIKIPVSGVQDQGATPPVTYIWKVPSVAGWIRPSASPIFPDQRALSRSRPATAAHP